MFACSLDRMALRSWLCLIAAAMLPGSAFRVACCAATAHAAWPQRCRFRLLHADPFGLSGFLGSSQDCLPAAHPSNTSWEQIILWRPCLVRLRLLEKQVPAASVRAELLDLIQ